MGIKLKVFHSFMEVKQMEARKSNGYQSSDQRGNQPFANNSGF